MIYHNPVLSGFYPDPSVCTDGQKYYLVNSTFQFFPGVPVFESDDLINWKLINHCLTRDSQLPLETAHKSEGIFAPTIRYNDGYFFMITTNVSGGGNFLVYTDNIYGEWSEPVWLPKLQGIDPSLLFADGKCYFTGNGEDEQGKSGIFLSEIDPFTGQQFTEPVCIWHGNGGRYLEGPHLYKINGYYYLMAAEGGTEYGHMEVYARSTSPYGPFESYANNPFLTNRNLGGYVIQGVGHADMVEDRDGNYWLVHLAFRQTDKWLQHHITGRETYLVPVTFDEDGWFTAGVNDTTTLTVDTDRIPDNVTQTLDRTYTFENTELLKDWIVMRSQEVSYIEKASDNAYHITGTEHSICESLGVPAFMGIRQTEMYGDILCHLSLLAGDMGVTLYMDEEHHYDLMLSEKAGEVYGVLRLCIGDVIHNQCIVNLKGSREVTVRVSLDPMRYGFEMIHADEVISFGTANTRYLSTETAGGFTGVLIGLFAEPHSEGFFSDFIFDAKRYKD